MAANQERDELAAHELGRAQQGQEDYLSMRFRAALASSVLQLLYFASLAGGAGRRRR